jgi:hypothetical protein
VLGKPNLQFFGFDIRWMSEPLPAFATWDSGAAVLHYQWKFLRLAVWKLTELDRIGDVLEQSSAVIVPDWLLVCVLATLPLLRLRRFSLDRQRLRRRLEHRCDACGYDLCASEDRCPECGTPIKANEGASA